MNCPKCNGDTFVVDTRGVRRRRHCKACGCRFTTEEILVGMKSKRAQPKPSQSLHGLPPGSKFRIRAPKTKPEVKPEVKPEPKLKRPKMSSLARRRIEEMRDLSSLNDDYDYIPENW